MRIVGSSSVCVSLLQIARKIHYDEKVRVGLDGSLFRFALGGEQEAR